MAALAGATAPCCRCSRAVGAPKCRMRALCARHGGDCVAGAVYGTKTRGFSLITRPIHVQIDF